MGQDMKFVSEACELPRLFKLGVAYGDTLMGSPINTVLDYCLPSDNENTLHLGTEYIYRNVIAVRFGYNSSSDSDSDSKFSWGIGLMVKRGQIYKLDYSFHPQGVLGDSHTVSLLIRF
jgi:hypothetical protein